MKPITALKKRYASNSEEVREYMCDLLDKLNNDYGSIDSSWTVALDMVCDWYQMYVDAVSKLKGQGVTYVDDNGRIWRNPNFEIMKTSTKQINDLLKTFATDPVSKSRLNYLKQRGCEPVDDEQILEDMLK